MGIHVGTSGWSYGHWDGVLYPPGTRLHERLGVMLEETATVSPVLPPA